MTTRLEQQTDCCPSQRAGTNNIISAQEDMQFADEAFDILGFSKEEKYNVYKVRTKEERETLLTFI